MLVATRPALIINEIYRLGELAPVGTLQAAIREGQATLMIERYVATDSAGFGPHLALFISLAKEGRSTASPQSRIAASGSGSPAIAPC